MTIKSKIQTRVKRSKCSVFLRSDFKDIADYDQVGRALKSLVNENLLMKIGYGLYVRVRLNRINSQLMPDHPSGADGVLIEAMEKLGVDYQLDEASLRTISGQSPQIPAKINIRPMNSRFTRTIKVGTQVVNAD